MVGVRIRIRFRVRVRVRVRVSVCSAFFLLFLNCPRFLLLDGLVLSFFFLIRGGVLGLELELG